MFPQEKRVGNARDITKVYRKGKKISEEGVLISAMASDHKESRFAVTVSKKFSGKAVARNKQRRALLAAAREISPSIMQPHDITISYNNAQRMLSYDESLRLLTKAFEKIQLVEQTKEG